MKGQLLSTMIILAAQKHNQQMDKGGQPYILHPLAVLYLLNSEDEELQCIAVGHDLMEDCDVTASELRTLGFSERVIDGISALTRVPGQSYKLYKLQVKSNLDAIQVKLADLAHNMNLNRPFRLSIEHRNRYLEFYAELLKELR